MCTLFGFELFDYKRRLLKEEFSILKRKNGPGHVMCCDKVFVILQSVIYIFFINKHFRGATTEMLV